MPLIIDKIKIAGTKYDGRCKLNEDQRDAIRILSREHYSQRKLAAMFNVSKRLVQSIIHPPVRSPEAPKSPEYWAEAKRKHREKKKGLYKAGKIKLDEKKNKK